MARRKRDDGILAVVAELPRWVGVSEFGCSGPRVEREGDRMAGA